MPTPRVVFALLLGLLLGSLPAAAQVDQILKQAGLEKKSGPLSNDKVAAGLKEALRVGTGNAVNLTGKVDGYFKNEAIKILMPEKLRTLEKGLRTVGYGPKVDEFVLSMNRAAERAAPFAKDIFWGAIKEMTFEDARNILTGGDTAATQYFREKTSDKLAAAFRPVVEKAMNEVGATRKYKDMVGQARSLPFVRTQALDIDQYVVTKALDGLFHVVGEEEKKIRKNPADRVTSLLKEVFGRQAP